MPDMTWGMDIFSRMETFNLMLNMGWQQGLERLPRRIEITRLLKYISSLNIY